MKCCDITHSKTKTVVFSWSNWPTECKYLTSFNSILLPCSSLVVTTYSENICNCYSFKLNSLDWLPFWLRHVYSKPSLLTLMLLTNLYRACEILGTANDFFFLNFSAATYWNKHIFQYKCYFRNYAVNLAKSKSYKTGPDSLECLSVCRSEKYFHLPFFVLKIRL